MSNRLYDIGSVDTLEDGNGVRKMRKFFGAFSHNFAAESINFYDKYWGQFPFIHSEKQVNSVVVPAIHKTTENVWLEQPYKTNSEEQKFLDITTIDGANIYLIELKHSWNSKTDNIASYTDSEWERAIEQIAELKKSHVKKFLNVDEYNIFRVALMVMPTFVTNDLEHNICQKSSKEYAMELFNQYQQYRSKKYNANYVATWKLDNHKKYKHGYKDDKEQVYPFISFVARAERVFE